MARWSLFLAAVLQFGAAAVGPYAHLVAPSPRAALAQESRGGEDPGTPVPDHGEQACPICHSLATSGVLPSPSILPFGSEVAVRDLPEHPPVLRSLRGASTRARAPPLA